ncbi:MAG: magnesium transporter MgtE N-terminal domain-containing protein [Opitutaceae bacterium]
MSEQKLKLAVAFIESHPRAAAEMLEQKSASEVAAFLQKAPAENAAAVLIRMLKKSAASVITEVTVEYGLQLFHHLKPSEIAGILRCLSPKRRERYMKELPTKTQLSCVLLLGYSEGMVGAYLTNAVVVVRHDSTASEALHLIKSSKDSVPSNYVFTLDAEGHLKGRFRMVELLRCPEDFPVSSLVKGSLHTIQGRMNIKEALKCPDWMRCDSMPVVNRGGEFIGILRHSDLRKAIDAQTERVVHDEKPELLAGIAQGYGQSLLALFLSMKEMALADIHSMGGAKND